MIMNGRFGLNDDRCRTRHCDNYAMGNGLCQECYYDTIRCGHEDCDESTYKDHTLCRKHWHNRGCMLCGSKDMSLWKYKRMNKNPHCGHCCIKCTKVIEHPNAFYPKYCSHECSGICHACGVIKHHHEGFVYDSKYGYDHSKDPRKVKCNYGVCPYCGQWRFARFGTGDRCVECRNVDLLEKHIGRLPEIAFGEIRKYV